MPSIVLQDVKLSEAEFRSFFISLQEFMKREVQPSYVGMEYVKFRAQLDKDGFEIVVETNKALNQGSTQQLRNMIRGFLGGWQFRGGFPDGDSK